MKEAGDKDPIGAFFKGHAGELVLDIQIVEN